MTHVIRCVAAVQKGQEVEKMKELNASTSKGKQILERATRHDGYLLSDVYDNYSHTKEIAYNWCLAQYLVTDNHSDFSICSHNTFGFTRSWLGTKDGEKILRYETKDNSYLVA